MPPGTGGSVALSARTRRVLERAFWADRQDPRRRVRWTDDTQMSIDLAESLLARGTLDPDDLAQRFAASYRWNRGYGPGAARC